MLDAQLKADGQEQVKEGKQEVGYTPPQAQLKKKKIIADLLFHHAIGSNLPKPADALNDLNKKHKKMK